MYDLITCYTAIQDTQNLIKCHERMFNAGSDFIGRYYALRDLSRVYKKIGNIDEEIHTYERILRISDLTLWSKIDTYNALIEIYERQGNVHKLIRFHELVLGIPEVDNERRCSAFKALGIIYQKLGKNAEAFQCYLSALPYTGELPKEQVGVLCRLADLWADKEEKAVGYYRRAVQVSEKKKQISKKIRLIALSSWINFYHKSGAKIGDADLLTILTKLELIVNYPKKVECCKSILKLSNLPQWGLERLVKIFHQIGERLQEIECYERILKMDGVMIHHRLSAFNHLVILYSLTNNVVKAKEIYRESVELGAKAEDQYDGLCYLGEAYGRNGQTDKAIKCYEKILMRLGMVAGAEYEALNNLASIYVRTRRPNAAIKCYYRIIESNNINEELQLKALKGLVLVFEKVERVDKEIECYERILCFPKTDFMDHSEAIKKLIAIYNKIGDVGYMVKGYERILNLPGITLSIKQAVCSELGKIHAERF